MNKKYIIVTGWVLSGIGKWVTTASAGFFLSEKYSITPIKLDGYLNVDPGTMNPHEHGEVFVLEDGAEVDMDFGHYERFLWVNCHGNQSISMGKIYKDILDKERKGDFLGKTVQMIPHVTNHIVEKIQDSFQQSAGDICMIEVGGTVGDIEVELYIQALRQLRHALPKWDFVHLHLTYVPIPGWVDEQKTKPTQQSISLLQSKGLFPDAIMARWSEYLTESSKRKIALFSNLEQENIFSLPDVSSIYSIPGVLKQQYFEIMLCDMLGIPAEHIHHEKIKAWNNYLTIEKNKTVTIGIIWKYTALEDSYSSVVEALKHVGQTLGVQVNIDFINTRDSDWIAALKNCDGAIVPGWFWDSAIENMITTLKYTRENKIPTLGICLWMQLMMIEYARNVMDIPQANSLEFNSDCAPHDIITLLESQKDVINLWWTMRLWKHNTIISQWQIKDLYTDSQRISQQSTISERFRHRYEVHPEFAKQLEWQAMKVSWKSEQEWIVQFIELDAQTHPYYIATQSHPELTSKLEDPAPLFIGLVKACIKKQETI